MRREDEKSNFGGTALHRAAASGHEAVVRLLLENGAGVDVQDKLGATALRGAAASGHEAVVRLLLENGAGVDDKSKFGRSALHRAVASGHEAVVRLLLEDGAGVDDKNKFVATALHWAAARGQKNITANAFLKHRRTAQNTSHLQKYPDVKSDPASVVIQEQFLECLFRKPVGVTLRGDKILRATCICTILISVPTSSVRVYHLFYGYILGRQ